MLTLPHELVINVLSFTGSVKNVFNLYCANKQFGWLNGLYYTVMDTYGDHSAKKCTSMTLFGKFDGPCFVIHDEGDKRINRFSMYTNGLVYGQRVVYCDIRKVIFVTDGEKDDGMNVSCRCYRHDDREITESVNAQLLAQLTVIDPVLDEWIKSTGIGDERMLIRRTVPANTYKFDLE